MSLVSSTRIAPGQHVTSRGLGGFLRGAARVGVGLLTGGPAGGVAAGASLLVGRGDPQQPPSPRGIPIPRFGPGRTMPTAPVARNGASAAGGSPGPGWRLNKSDYFLRDGTFVPKGTRWVKSRRRNPMNVRALSRAISRVDAGKAWQSKLASITTKKYTSAGKRKDRC